MQVWHSSSSERKPCVICGKKTATYKVYEQSGMEIRVPLCDYDIRPSCYSLADVKKETTRFLIELKKTIRNTNPATVGEEAQ